MSKGKNIKRILFICIILIGLFIFVYGGYDDSPGAQLIGLIIFVIGINGLWRSYQKNRP